MIENPLGGRREIFSRNDGRGQGNGTLQLVRTRAPGKWGGCNCRQEEEENGIGSMHECMNFCMYVPLARQAIGPSVGEF